MQADHDRLGFETHIPLTSPRDRRSFTQMEVKMYMDTYIDRRINSHAGSNLYIILSLATCAWSGICRAWMKGEEMRVYTWVWFWRDGDLETE